MSRSDEVRQAAVTAIKQSREVLGKVVELEKLIDDLTTIEPTETGAALLALRDSIDKLTATIESTGQQILDRLTAIEIKVNTPQTVPVYPIKPYEVEPITPWRPYIPPWKSTITWCYKTDTNTAGLAAAEPIKVSCSGQCRNSVGLE